MSHYAVMVLTERDQDVDDLLLPYMENCCSEPPYEYMEFYEDEDAEVDDVTGRRGYWQNPNAKWDYYEVGGRFSGRLLRRDGVRCDVAPVEELDLDSAPFTTYAVVTPDGEWHAPGEMGWFGFSSETPEQLEKWNVEYTTRFLEGADPRLIATVCDCHI